MTLKPFDPSHGPSQPLLRTHAMLVRELTATLSAIGFDPYRGFYHQPRYGRPALALDVMEPFRPILAGPAGAVRRRALATDSAGRRAAGRGVSCRCPTG